MHALLGGIGRACRSRFDMVIKRILPQCDEEEAMPHGVDGGVQIKRDGNEHFDACYCDHLRPESRLGGLLGGDDVAHGG